MAQHHSHGEEHKQQQSRVCERKGHTDVQSLFVFLNCIIIMIIIFKESKYMCSKREIPPQSDLCSRLPSGGENV